MSISAERALAARLLVRVEGGAFATPLLAGFDAAVRARVLEVLRWLRPLDAVLGRSCRRPLERLDPEVRAALRLALAEHAFLGVPAAVATDACVHSVRRLGKGSAASLANAVLRRAVIDWPAALSDAAPDVRLSHPEWLYRRWVANLGEETAVAIMTVDQLAPKTWVWFVDDAARDAIAGRGIELVAHPWCPGAWTVDHHAHELMVAVERGQAHAQDPSSQLVALLGVRLAGDGGRLLDLCAAPGGKTALLVRSGRFHQALACDRSLRRARMVAHLAGSSGVRVIAADAIRPPVAGEGWDLVLLDAPCSGTGTLRRHPELRWRLTPQAVTGSAGVQERLLAVAFGLVAPGGLLLYATCSLEPEENEALLDRLPVGFAVEPLAPLLGEVTFRATSAGGVRILPTQWGDGFTVHAMRREGRSIPY